MNLYELDYLYTPETTLYDRITALAFIDELDEFFQNTLTTVEILRDLNTAQGFALCGLARALVCDVGGMSDDFLEGAKLTVDMIQLWCQDEMCRDELSASWKTLADEFDRRWACPLCGEDSRYGEHGVVIPATLYEPPDFWCPGEDDDGELPY